jgi:hypothetical protein
MTDDQSTCLTRAQAIVDGERDGNHGGVEQNLKQTAQLWNAYMGLGEIFLPEDVGMMMVLLKVSRFSANPNHPDNLDDAAGWIRCTEKVKSPTPKGEA